MRSKILIIVIAFLLFIKCKSVANEENSKVGYTDGEYCAEIAYYNPKTEMNSTYTLVVEIEGNALTIIQWPNGGWLDSTHFTPPDISEGKATFTSDKGVEYHITIIGAAADCPSLHH
jgi:hypothetical protein